jgi:hypothetical protein
MNEGPSVGDILIGIFIILFGLCLALTGGGCTVFIVGALGQQGGGNASVAALLLVSLAVLALGLFLTWIGFKMMTGRFRK